MTWKIGEAVDPRDPYGEALVRLGRQDSRVVVLEADLMKASGSILFKNEFPERHFNVGIAEQNLVSVAAGLASMGKIPFASAFAGFLSQRACDQDVNAVCYNNLGVKLVGTYGGLTQEKNGGMHIGVEDLAIFRCMPNMTVVVPCDCVELQSAMEAVAKYPGPVYLRVARGPMKTIMPPDYRFEIGKAVILGEGTDVTLITTGITTWEGKVARETLAARGISARHVHMPTVKPIDRSEVLRAAKETGAIVTVENHSRLGGLGGSVAEIVCDECPVPVCRVGIDDRFGQTATLDWLMREYGVTSGHVVDAVGGVLKRKAGGSRTAAQAT
jgi:transketolase